MKIARRFTTAGQDPFDSVTWVKRASRIINPDGSIVFEMTDAEVPASWSQLATDIMVSKYFRKAGVPSDGGPNGLPSPAHKQGDPVEPGPEKSARQVIHRLAGCWRAWGESHGYFDTPADAQAFYDELAYMMTHQMAAPNSPQWFNTGLSWAYGITGPPQGHFVADPTTGKVSQATDAYSHPQPHACFIQSISDDLVNPGGIMDLWVREARLFKYGSGTGTNFSALRGEDEPLSGGGKSSGLMSWLKIGDRAAGAIKSGGTTRRAAKMVCLDLDHPDIEAFVNWKVREEIKVAALVEGLKRLKSSDEEIRETVERLGLELTYDFNGEAYMTVSGQNSNNSVRIPDAFFEALDADERWTLRNRLDPDKTKEIEARDLWEQIGFAAWRCADPGVQYDTTINAWHTCPAGGRINASNPCSEYMFLDDTACNLASLNVLKFFDQKTRTFDLDAYEHAVDLWTIVLEISVLMAAFPSEAIARKSFDYRTLGLGYANLGAALMQAGIPYDSEEGRAVCAALTAALCGRSYRQSAAMAAQLGPFAEYRKNKDSMLRVMRNHRRAAHGVARQTTGKDAYEGLSVAPEPIDHTLLKSGRVRIGNADELLSRATSAWDEALQFGEKHGYRNAQVTVIAPTGTIGLLMDCDTTGVEPDFALVKFKKLAGGGYFRIANASLRPALESLGYSEEQVRDILTYVMGTLSLDEPMPGKDGGAPTGTGTLADFLKAKGLLDEDLERVKSALPSVFELGHAFSVWGIGDDALARLGVDPEQAKADPGFELLRKLGLTRKQIDALNERICGTQTVEGAPHLKDEHLPVFDCASACGRRGTRSISAEGHIRMMAAAQPFISGAISKTINLPNSATVDDIKEAYRLSWELGLKANALYRDGCKLSQPLSSKSRDEDERSGDSEHEEEGGRGVDVASVRVLEEAHAVLDPAGEDELDLEAAREEAATHAVRAAHAASEMNERAAARIVEKVVHRPMRRRLPDTRRSMTHKFNVAGHEGYLTVGLYDDGRPGELFITMAKEGSTIGGLMDSLGTATSVALQYGVPIESLVKKFAHQRFEPAGMTGNRDIPFAKSLVDYIFRWLGQQFVLGYKAATSPMTSIDDDSDTEAERTGLDSSGFALHPEANGGNGRAPAVEAKSVAKATDRARPSVRIEREEVEMELVRGADGSVMTHETRHRSALSAALSDAQSDAPACDVCGQITVRSGSCYKCLNCGQSMGCS